MKNESISVINRLLLLPDISFFLFGPRGTGKSTWLKQVLPDAVYFDLLDSALYRELAQYPDRLEPMIGNPVKSNWVIIDEIQKVPVLLDEVHRLIETKKLRFALCGSSARKLRKGGVNLLGGRAITINLESFVFNELDKLFKLDHSIKWGTLPLIQFNTRESANILDAYVNTYIKEEIKEEGIIRSLPPFLRFLEIAGLMNGQIINSLNISREASIPRSTVDVYFSILQDSLLGHFLPAYKPKLKVREQTHPKFYWFDPGIARAAAKLLFEPIDRIWAGISLETLIYHELRVYNQARNKHRQIYYYRTQDGVEIDFVIETRKQTQSSLPEVVCIEVKSTDKWHNIYEKPLHSMIQSNKIKVKHAFCVYKGDRAYYYNNLTVLPVTEFLEWLYQDKIF